MIAKASPASHMARTVNRVSRIFAPGRCNRSEKDHPRPRGGGIPRPMGS